MPKMCLKNNKQYKENRFDKNKNITIVVKCGRYIYT